MRKSKIVNIEGLGEVTVKEITPLAVYVAMTSPNKVEEITSLFVDCLDLPKEKIAKLYLSEIEQLIEAFLEVNNAFFVIVGKLGLEPLLGALVAELKTILPPLFADSYKTVMAKLPGIMAGASFLSPSEPSAVTNDEPQ